MQIDILNYIFFFKNHAYLSGKLTGENIELKYFKSNLFFICPEFITLLKFYS